MAIDDTKAGLERVLAALTADEPPPAVASLATPPAPPSTGPLDEALRETRLELWYQPKIDIKQRCLAGAEALARIRDPDKGVLLPASFLPGVSDDVLARLTEHALLTVLRDWTIFDEAGFNLRLAINAPVNLPARLPIGTIVTERRPPPPVPEAPRALLRGAQAQPQLRQGLRRRSDQCGDLPDRDRPRPPLRQ